MQSVDMEAVPKMQVGWAPGCPCNAPVVPQAVLDVFAGSGTTLAVAKRLRRDFTGIELNPKYIPLIEKRVMSYNPLPI